MTIYSIRTALGAELWWTTRRKSAVELAQDINALGEGARIDERGGCAVVAGGIGSVGLNAEAFPVSVFKCTPVKPKA